jgi:hypothetical protein
MLDLVTVIINCYMYIINIFSVVTFVAKYVY